MTTTQIGKLTKLIPYPSSLSNYNNYNITVSYHILIVLKIIAVQPVIVKHYTGLFISPFGISGLCDAVTGMVTPKGSMLTLRLLMSYMYIYIYIYIILVA